MDKPLAWPEAINHCRMQNEPWVLATVISTQGSVPRDSGTKMVITENANYDTIGGGQLEFRIIQLARQLIISGANGQTIEHIPLSAKVQQCCGGSVAVLLECFSLPLMDIHVFGAGHVAKALIHILAQFDAKVTWVDSRADEFPETVPRNIKTKMYEDVLEHVNNIPPEAYVLVLTHNHTLDYTILEALLDRKDCHYIGVIGSLTKAMRFKKRLKSASFTIEEIESFHCPVGLLDIPGKQPVEVAVSIAAQIIQYSHKSSCQKYDGSLYAKKTTGITWKEINKLLNSDQKDAIDTIKL